MGMILQDVIEDIHALYEDLKVYERKYGILSETFYELYVSGTEPENDDWVLDWSDWAGAYKLLVRRQEHIPPNIKSNRIPAQHLSFTQPNLPVLIQEMESLVRTKTI